MKKRSKPARRPPKAASLPPEGASSPLPGVASEPGDSFPIVGIGASAGGLEALELFLANVPEGSGMAYVIVQHLDPTHKGIMVKLLQRRTTMTVVEVKDRMRVKPDKVYLIPPNKDMSILHGVLHLLDPAAPRGQRLPIDSFFRALAEDQQIHSIGVILSGMGSDGRLGARAIKEKAGVVLVQEPSSAKFEGMPRSTIDAGLADVIAPPEALPGKISTYLEHVALIPNLEEIDQGASQSALEKVVILLRSQTGHDFSLYKKNTIYRRIERRRGLHQIANINDYVRFLQRNTQEVELLFHELLIGVTRFFRDPEAWEQLKADVIPALFAGRPSNQTRRAWIPGCSTGEEAYSLAILFKEGMDELAPAEHFSLQIYATDLDQHAIEKGRKGMFPANIAADVSSKRLDRFFVKVEHGYQVAQSIREMVIFARHNLVMDPPFNKLDILSCRNLLIYMRPELQEKLVPLFHYSLNPGGFLFLGKAESVGDFSNLFKPLDRRSRLYQRRKSALPTAPIELPLTLHTARPTARAIPHIAVTDLQVLADRLILQTFAPAAVLTNDKGDILYVSGHTGRYLEPAAGKANWNIFAMAREDLRNELMVAFKKVLRKKETVTVKNRSVVTNGGTHVVDVTIQPLTEDDALQGMLIIVFNEAAKLPQRKTTGKSKRQAAQKIALEREVEEVSQEMYTMREEMQASEEELRAANEELQSTNEELQSTNEELTTSKEELQSMNEELHTVNQELQNRLDELSGMDNDMRNLLDSTEIATLFLDKSLCVRRFTRAMGKFTNLIPTDVGRPVTDIASDLLYPELAHDGHEVMRTCAKVEREISTPDGSWWAVNLLPYQTMNNTVDGVVITFLEITGTKKLEEALRANGVRLQKELDHRK
jgi:two-component system CheB/CheR fusion protein